MKTFNLSTVFLMILSLWMIGCGDDNQGSFPPPPIADIYFQLVDDSGDPLAHAFVGVINQFGGAGSPQLAFTDEDGDTCADPESGEPSLSNGQLTYAGCTDENGVVKLRIDFTFGGVNCSAALFDFHNLDLFIKAEDGSTAYANETCDYIHDNTSPDDPEHVQIYDLDL